MESSPLFVSVIIPVHNGERFLVEALENVLEQNYHPLEIIVIDDGSTDRTKAIANHYQHAIRYLYQENKGPAAARNLGIKTSRGNIVAFLDVDDLWSVEKLRTQTAVLSQHAGCDIVQGSIQEMKLDESACGPEWVFAPSSEPYQFLNLGSAIYRKNVFEKVGLFDENLWDNEDTDWFIRAWKANVSKIVMQEVALYYRKHPNNLTAGQGHLVHFGLLKLCKKHLELERTRGLDEKLQKIDLPNYAEFIGKPPEGKAAQCDIPNT